MKTFFLVPLVSGFLSTVFCKEWELKNTGIPIAMGIGEDKLWIVSDQAFSCLQKNSEFIWRVAAGEKIIQSEIVLEKGILYLSREQEVAKVGLRSLETGNLKWETHVGNVHKFSLGDHIYLDDNTALDFDGSPRNAKRSVYNQQKEGIQVTNDAIHIGSNKFSYNSVEFGEPKLYEADGKDLLLSSESGLTMFYRDLKLLWTRDESLTQVIASIFVKLDQRDVWVGVTKPGTVVALDALNGTKLWRLFFKDRNLWFIGSTESEDLNFVNVCSKTECIQINMKNGKFHNNLKDDDLMLLSSIKTSSGDTGLVSVDSNFMVSLYSNNPSVKESFENSTFYFYRGIEEGSKSLSGYQVLSETKVLGKYSSKKVWSFDLPETEVIIAVSKNQGTDPIASLGRVLGDRSVLYKYLNPNLVAFMTESTLKDSMAVTFYLVDVVSGFIHHRAFHPGGGRIKGQTSSTQILLNDNFAVYTYWNHGPERGKDYLKGPFANQTIPNTKGMEVVSLEIYESEKPIKNFQGPFFTSFSSFSPFVISAAFMFPFPITCLGITRTMSGITSKDILFGLKSGNVFSLSRKFLDPRRPVGPLSSLDKEEELLPYSPLLDYNPLNSIQNDVIFSK